MSAINDVYVTKKENPSESEKFDPLKLHSSITSACYAVRTLEGEAHLTAQHVCERVIEWLSTKNEVTSGDIRRVATKFLHVYHPEAAYIYQNYEAVL